MNFVVNSTINRSLMSDADGDLTSGQEGGGNDDDDDVNAESTNNKRGDGGVGGARRPDELESLQSGVSSDVEEGVNVEKKVKRFGK